MKLEQKIKKLGFEVGFDLVSVASLEVSKFGLEVEDWLRQGRQGEMAWYEKNVERRLDPRKNLYGQALTSISVGLFYRPEELPLQIISDPSRGIIARYALYNDYHKIMEKMLKLLSQKITQEIKKWKYVCYVDTGPVLEREISARAGLGFGGKNTTLINTTLGSYVFLGEILCDLEVSPDKREQKDVLHSKHKHLESSLSGKGADVQGTCGSCVRCQIACPTQAFVKPYVLDARRCISYLTIENRGAIPIGLRKFLKNRIYGCDICQEVCPWNKKIDSRITSGLTVKIEQAPLLLDLLSLTKDGFLKKYKGMPILRAKYAGFMRNVLVAAGNWADDSAWSLVLKLMQNSEPLVRQHAAWALWQINKKQAQGYLKELKKIEQDKQVLQELDRLLLD